MSRPGTKLIKIFVGLSALALTGLFCGNLIAGNSSDTTYLALGDSVAFGLDVTLLTGPPPPPPPSVFIGYPEQIANLTHLAQSNKEVNASCPGETSGSFITGTAPDFGCHDLGPQGQPPFKTSIGLHTNYDGSQLQFAIDQLSANKHISLVTLGIGSNDVLKAIAPCPTAPNPTLCEATNLPPVLITFQHNLVTILKGIRQTAGYKGKLVLVLYYSPSAELIPVAVALNAATILASAPYGVTFADGFTAFQLAALPQGGDVCKAGLLIHLSATTCDIHPSPKGRDILANTVLAVIGGKI